jgi:hypothetical protein
MPKTILSINIMKSKDWTKNPFVIALGIIASLAAILGVIYTIQDHSKKKDPSTPISSSPVKPFTDNVILKFYVLDDDKKPLDRVKASTVSSDSPLYSDDTDINGYVELPVPRKSIQVKLFFLKDGYEPANQNNIDVTAYAKITKVFYLKKK